LASIYLPGTALLNSLAWLAQPVMQETQAASSQGCLILPERDVLHELSLGPLLITAISATMATTTN